MTQERYDIIVQIREYESAIRLTQSFLGEKSHIHYELGQKAIKKYKKELAKLKLKLKRLDEEKE